MAKALRYVLALARTVAGGRGDRGRRDRRVGEPRGVRSTRTQARCELPQGTPRTHAMTMGDLKTAWEGQPQNPDLVKCTSSSP